jgi:multidrug resistance efflux pump
MKWVLAVTFMIPLVGVASWQLSSGQKGGQPKASIRLESDSSVVGIQGVGYVEPFSEVRQLMLRTGGVIRKCYVKAGDSVRKGEVILELQDATQKADVELARRNVEMLRADATNVNVGINPYKIKVTEMSIERLREKLRHFRAEAARYRTMLASKSASLQEHEAMETQRRQTEAELKEQEAELEHMKHFITPENRDWQASRIRHAQANLELVEERLRETKLLAPFDGTVLKLVKREGEGVRVFEPEPVVLFGALANLRVRAEIDERFVKNLRVDQRAEVYGRNMLGKTYPGRVVEVEPIMGDKTVFTRASSERKELNVLQVVIEMEPGFSAPVGLQVDVRITLAPD